MADIKKQELVEELSKNVADAKAVIFTHYHGLSATQLTELRQNLKEVGALAVIAKNTLLKRALGEEINTKLTDLTGPTLTIFSLTDAIAGIKTVFDFSKKNELPEIRAGIIDGQVVSGDQLKILSTLPSKEELLTKIVISMKSPITGFVGVLTGTKRNFVSVLSEIATKKEVAQ